MDKVLEVQQDIKQNAGEVQDFLKVGQSTVVRLFGTKNKNKTAVLWHVLDLNDTGTVQSAKSSRKHLAYMHLGLFLISLPFSTTV